MLQFPFFSSGFRDSPRTFEACRALFGKTIGNGGWDDMTAWQSVGLVAALAFLPHLTICRAVGWHGAKLITIRHQGLLTEFWPQIT